MYFPLLRGKQFELTALRELSAVLQSSHFRPVIEPVRESTKQLETTIKSLNKINIKPIIIINSEIGKLKGKTDKFIDELYGIKDISFIPCVKYIDNIHEFDRLRNRIDGEKASYVESGVSRDLLSRLSEFSINIIPEGSPKIVLQQLSNIVLMNDPFKKKKRNADYPSNSYFSDLHVRYKGIHDSVIGFGDFNIAGSDYAESGGPAYVVTIHASYLDGNEFDAMSIKHFSSIDDGTPSNQTGKFQQALEKLVVHHQTYPGFFDDTLGLREFSKLHLRRHFPGLGQVKQFSMQHHIETICNYIAI
ncbi:sce7725 family protein [Pantoea sp. GD03673]|uniref:sce7725 family protein n=1 Tax=Pantoea sp. GD03673 TaxID=2975364 RepID=UPI00244CD687|nr:sce7725 family protein [Pantoea sp. GD03673]MDH2068924.1 sce7725 family protein [Pantoea sp. GD03673]